MSELTRKLAAEVSVYRERQAHYEAQAEAEGADVDLCRRLAAEMRFIAERLHDLAVLSQQEVQDAE